MKVIIIIWILITYFTPTIIERNVLKKEYRNKETIRLNLLLWRTIIIPLYLIAETLGTKLIIKKEELRRKEFLIKKENN